MQKNVYGADGMQHKRTMSIAIEHFGPILRGKIELKPLTLFVGPNGCGKSHAATLLYTISRLEQDYERARFFGRGIPISEQIKKEATSLEKKRQNRKNKIIRTEILSKLANPETDLKRMFRDNFGVPNKELIQKGQSRASLRIKTRKHDNIQIDLTASKIGVQGVSPPSIKVLFDNQGEGRPDAREDDGLGAAAPIRVPPQGGLFEIYDALIRRIIRSHDEGYNVYYFPAERAGLMLAYKPLTDYYIGHPGTRRYSAGMPAVATDYLRFLNSLPSEQGAFASIANDAEKTILRGEVTANGQHSRADIYFQESQNKFPLRMAASSVKDLAAFFLYLKFVAEKNDLVVLEEPETNLHPKNQIELAKFIARLINCGLYIVLTTHSPYFLEQLSHCIMSGQAHRTDSNDVLPAEESLSPDMVAAYKFESIKKHYKITRMGITSEGIPQDEFLSIDDGMYLELSRLRQANGE
ncbi:MAG: AAA family ATPase [Thaumarchaeota archaeon]|nr:AAA family ATPase [Nitrososphaerota archaeon]